MRKCLLKGWCRLPMVAQHLNVLQVYFSIATSPKLQYYSSHSLKIEFNLNLQKLNPEAKERITPLDQEAIWIVWITTGCNHTPSLKHPTLKQWRVLWKGLEDSLIRCTEKGFNGPFLRCVQWVLMRQITLKNELANGVLFVLFWGNLSPVFQQVQKQVCFSNHALPLAGVFLYRRKEKGGEGLLKHAGWLPIIKEAKQGTQFEMMGWGTLHTEQDNKVSQS